MCKISPHLKLCTCNTDNIEDLPHYWLLKGAADEGANIVGEAILPADIGEGADQLNEKTIVQSLNSGNCFDVELHLTENDLLQLHFTLRPKDFPTSFYYGPFLAYAFRFKDNKWHSVLYDPFEGASEEIQAGKIKKPF